MKKIILFLCLAWQALVLNAQTFEVKDSLSIDSVSIGHFLSLDLNNNRFSDLLMSVKMTDHYELLFKDGSAIFFDTVEVSSLVSPVFYTADLDNNTWHDIIFSSLVENDTVLMISYQEAEMQFSEPEAIDIGSVQQLSVFDIDSDGFKELVYSDMMDNLHVKVRDSTGWIDFNKDLTFETQHWMLFDSNKNGFADLVRVKDKKVYTHLWKDEFWQEQDSVIFEGDILYLSHGDLNTDGTSEIVFYGTQDDTNYFIWALSDSINIEISLPKLHNAKVYLHDFNSDGEADILVSGLKNDSSSYLDLFVENEGVWESDSSDYNLSFNYLTINDVDYDGDIDILTLDGLSTIKVVDNITEVKNFGPTLVPNHFAFVNGRRVIIKWDPASDDFTDSLSLTYDVGIGDDLSNVKYLGPNFDLMNFYRRFSSVGNSGLRTEIGINRDFDNGVYFYCIQSIDNATYFLGNGTGAPVAIGQFVICEDNEAETRYACEGEVIEIVTESPVAYYSELRGYLGYTDSLFYEVSESDLIMTGQQGEVSCEMQKSYDIKILDNADLFGQQYITSCSGDELSVSIEDQFDSVQWYFNGELLSESLALQLTASESGIIKLNAFRGNCFQTDSLELILGNPMLKMPNDLSIYKGESAMLNASANNYETVKWSPAAGLDNDKVLNPNASPLKTTTYQLTVEDSIGCTAEGSVKVIVLERAWIPDLFTPNDDGNNDNLLIYGLEAATEVRLEIFNRSGNKVFEESDLQSLTQKGWDGTNSGQKQPSGLYFWKVTGRNNDGSELKLNGKTDGVVYLMR